MTITSIRSGAEQEFRRIELSDGSFFSLKTCYLPPVFPDEGFFTPGVAEGRVLSTMQEAGFRHASVCLRAERAALRLVARAEQCFFGLSRKLERRGYNMAVVDMVLARLAELNLVDDRRFACFWLEARILRSDSPRRLLAALCSKGVDRSDAEAAMKTVLTDDVEAALLLRFAKKLWRSRSFRRGIVGTELNSETVRTFRFALKYEGFSSAAITHFLEDESPLDLT